MNKQISIIALFICIICFAALTVSHAGEVSKPEKSLEKLPLAYADVPLRVIQKVWRRVKRE